MHRLPEQVRARQHEARGREGRELDLLAVSNASISGLGETLGHGLKH